MSIDEKTLKLITSGDIPEMCPCPFCNKSNFSYSVGHHPSARTSENKYVCIGGIRCKNCNVEKPQTKNFCVSSDWERAKFYAINATKLEWNTRFSMEIT